MGISLGVVGLGMFGSEFARFFASHPLVDRVILCDREADRIEAVAGKPGLKGKINPGESCASLEEVLRSDVDAVVLFTQFWLHAPQAIAALEADKHVYSAVPLISLPDGDEMLEWCDKLVKTCQRTGKQYMNGETTCYRPQAMYCRRRAAEGAFGRFVHADAQYLHDVDSPGCSLREVRQSRLAGAAGKEWMSNAGRYREREVKDGPMHYPTHSVGGPLWVMNTRAIKVCAWGTPVPQGDEFFAGAAFCNETALFHLANGATMRICEARKIWHPGEEMFSISGTEGSFRGSEGAVANHWFDKSGATTLTDDEMRDPLPEEVQQALAQHGLGLGGHGGSHAYLVHEFVTAVVEGRRPAISAWEAVRFLAPGVMAHKSALQDGALLDVPDWGDPPP